MELDPLSAYFSAQLGVCYYHANQFEQAVHHLRGTVATFPDFYMGHWTLGNTYRCLLKMDEAIEEYRKAVELSNQVPIVVAFLAWALYETGEEEEAGRLIKGLEKRSEKEYVPETCIYEYYLLAGDHDQAYRWVERAIREHDNYLPLGLIFPVKKYRIPNEPGYADLIKETGLNRFFQNK